MGTTTTTATLTPHQRIRSERQLELGLYLETVVSVAKIITDNPIVSGVLTAGGFVPGLAGEFCNGVTTLAHIAQGNGFKPAFLLCPSFWGGGHFTLERRPSEIAVIDAVRGHESRQLRFRCPAGAANTGVTIRPYPGFRNE